MLNIDSLQTQIELAGGADEIELERKKTRFSMIQENYLLVFKNRIVKWITYSS